MSAIFGVIHLDGAPAAADELFRMQQALAYWGGDGGGVWQQGNVGLGCNIRLDTPESRYETFPVTGAAGNLCLAGAARLDNREELGRILGLPEPEWPSTPDTRLLLLAYERWGQDCPKHLLGDWSLAVWDKPRQLLFLARDHCGMAGFYYYSDSRRLAFASGKKGLLALSWVPKKPNLYRLAQILTAWPGDGEQTAYEGIVRLPPAHSLTITGGQIVKRCYWRAEETPELHLPRQEDYHERFLELYQAAVTSRLRSLRPVAATLSGGLDSGSVCTLAARELAKENRRLPVFSSVPIHPTEHVLPANRCGNEAPSIEATARWAGNIDITYVPAVEVSPLAGLRRILDLTDEPTHGSGNAYWLSALLSCAQQDGFGVLLTGQSGNATVSWAGGPVNLWQLLRAANWPGLRQEFRLLAGSGWGQGLRHLIRQQLLHPLAVQARFFRELRQSSAGQPWGAYAAINPEWARNLNLTEKMRLAGHDLYYLRVGSTLPEERLRSLLPALLVANQMWTEAGAGHNLEVRDPTLDKRLLEFCAAIPNHCYYRQGRSRLLLRESFSGLMPPQVLWYRRRGRQAGDICYRVLSHASELQEVLNQLGHTVLGRECLDLPKMQEVLASLKVRATPENSWQCTNVLLRGMMVGLFLGRFEKIS